METPCTVGFGDGAEEGGDCREVGRVVRRGGGEEGVEEGRGAVVVDLTEPRSALGHRGGKGQRTYSDLREVEVRILGPRLLIPLIPIQRHRIKIKQRVLRTARALRSIDHHPEQRPIKARRVSMQVEVVPRQGDVLLERPVPGETAVVAGEEARGGRLERRVPADGDHLCDGVAVVGDAEDGEGDGGFVVDLCGGRSELARRGRGEKQGRTLYAF